MNLRVEQRHTAGRVAALWRGVRWGAAGFCVLQFAVYVPGPGVQVPWPLLRLGIGLAVLTALVNVVALLVERRRARAVSCRPARRDLVLLGADSAVVVGIVLLFAFEPTSAVWVLLVVPVLEAGLVGRLGWAMTIWAVSVSALLVREVLAVQLHGLPAPSGQALVSSVGFRAGVLLLVAAVVGFQSRVAHQHLQQLHAVQDKLAHEVGHDPLTGLANRRLFREQAERAVREQQRAGGLVGVLFVDCDSFKAVNDIHGHEAGDEVLHQVAARLAALAGPQDSAARLGGDEFALLLHRPAQHHRQDGAGGQDAVERCAAQVRAALAAPYQVAGVGQLAMSCSVGGAAYRAGETMSEVLRRADQAMYRQKLTTHH